MKIKRYEIKTFMVTEEDGGLVKWGDVEEFQDYAVALLKNCHSVILSIQQKRVGRAGKIAVYAGGLHSKPMIDHLSNQIGEFLYQHLPNQDEAVKPLDKVRAK